MRFILTHEYYNKDFPEFQVKFLIFHLGISRSYARSIPSPFYLYHALPHFSPASSKHSVKNASLDQSTENNIKLLVSTELSY